MRIALLLLILPLISCSPWMPGSRTVFISVTPVYERSPKGIRPLPNAFNDGEALEAELRLLAERSGACFESHRFIERNGRLVHMEKGLAFTSESLLSFIEQTGTEERDLVIFFFSGHGISIDGRSHLLADPEYGDDALLAVSCIREAMKKIKGTKCMLLDACGSGEETAIGSTLFRGEVFSEEGFLAGTYASEALREAFTVSSSTDGIYILAACTGGQEALDGFDAGLPGMRDHGYFTYCLLLSLGYDFHEKRPGLPDGEAVTFYSLLEGVKRNMDGMIWKRQTAQATMTALDLILFRIR